MATAEYRVIVSCDWWILTNHRKTKEKPKEKMDSAPAAGGFMGLHEVPYGAPWGALWGPWG